LTIGSGDVIAIANYNTSDHIGSYRSYCRSIGNRSVRDSFAHTPRMVI